ncbi:MAG: hypothetical protein MJ176_04635 [Treponema sp.]|nr:hypothetical protein [Treponema sp.]
MKKIFIFSIFLGIFLTACATNDTTQENVEEPKAPVIEITDDIIEEDVIDYNEDPVEDVEEDIITEEQAEYLRSIDSIEDSEVVSFDEFADDKAAILKIIDEMSEVMRKYNFDKWKNYIDPASIEYYSNPVNLRKTQKKLPDKTLQIKGLRDYFKFVFIPARQISAVDEIRYISKTNVKAVQVRPDEGRIIVYYYFVKVNGKWYVQLPPE